MLMVAVAMILGFVRTSLLLRLHVAERETCKRKGGYGQPDDGDDDGHACTSHRPLLFCGRNTPARITSGTTIRDRDVTWDYRTGAARSGGRRTAGTTVVDLAV